VLRVLALGGGVVLRCSSSDEGRFLQHDFLALLFEFGKQLLNGLLILSIGFLDLLGAATVLELVDVHHYVSLLVDLLLELLDLVDQVHLLPVGHLSEHLFELPDLLLVFL